jgi:hypothetical protein
MSDQDRLAEARDDRRGGVADMDHGRSPGGRALAGRPEDTDRGAVDPFRGQAEIMRNRHRRPVPDDTITPIL